MAYTQEHRFIAIDTPLGDDVLLLRGFSGYEGMSRLFRFDLDLLSEDAAIPFADIVGQNVTLTLVMADGSTRYFNGVISRFVQQGGDLQFTYYQAEMVPWLWFLTRTADCRIFQNMTVPDIIMKIFRDLGFSDFKILLQGVFEPRDYSGNRFQLCFPADGTIRPVLLLCARAKQAHAGAGELPHRASALPGPAAGTV
jgi:type VI secretion system secreted protein VgrG